MSVTRGFVRNEATFQRKNAAPDDGGSRASISTDEVWTEGTDTRQFDRSVEFSFDIPAASTQLLDLQAILMADGNALGLVECRHISFKADDTNPANVTIEPDATDGWTGLLAAAGDIINLQPGAGVELTAPIDGGYPVSGTNKELLLTNTDGSNSATVTGVIAGVSA